jgi:hypothetical protein
MVHAKSSIIKDLKKNFIAEKGMIVSKYYPSAK